MLRSAAPVGSPTVTYPSESASGPAALRLDEDASGALAVLPFIVERLTSVLDELDHRWFRLGHRVAGGQDRPDAGMRAAELSSQQRLLLTAEQPTAARRMRSSGRSSTRMAGKLSRIRSISTSSSQLLEVRAFAVCSFAAWIG